MELKEQNVDPLNCVGMKKGVLIEESEAVDNLTTRLGRSESWRKKTNVILFGVSGVQFESVNADYRVNQEELEALLSRGNMIPMYRYIARGREKSAKS